MIKLFKQLLEKLNEEDCDEMILICHFHSVEVNTARERYNKDKAESNEEW